MLIDSKKQIRYITNHIRSEHDSRTYMTVEQLKKFVDNLPDGYHIVGHKAFRGFDNIRFVGVTRNEETIHFDDKLAKQRLLLRIHFHYLKESSKKIIMNFLTAIQKR